MLSLYPLSPLQVTLCNCKAQSIAPGGATAQQLGGVHVSTAVIDLHPLSLQNTDWLSPVEKEHTLQQVTVITSALDDQQ